MYDVLVIGSGPAGLTAARTAANRGARVLVVEVSDWAGGRLAERVDTLPGPCVLPGEEHSVDLRADQLAKVMVDRTLATGVKIWTGTLAWGLFPGSVAILRAHKPDTVEAKAIVVATGSLPAPYPFAGWTLPGVMTAPAVERLINRHGFLPGRQAVVVGDTDEAARVSWLLELCGSAVRRVSALDAAMGRERVESVRLGGESFPADLVVLAVGRLPQVELPNAAGCKLQGNEVPWCDDRQATSVPRVLLAGSAAGAGSLSRSIWTGEVAGVTAAELAGKLAPEAAAAARADLFRMAPPSAELVAPTEPLPVDEFVHVCRCEEVPRTEIEDAIRLGAWTVTDIKRVTRVGMGYCQGKCCVHTVMNLLRHAGVSVRSEVLPMRLRPPVRSIRLGDLAVGGEEVNLLDRATHPERQEKTR